MTGMEPFLIPLAVGAASAGASALLAPKPNSIKPPTPAEPVRMPDPFQERANAREEQRQRRLKGAGRGSTMLDENDGTYLSDSLGE
jgi:hypothetical protein